MDSNENDSVITVQEKTKQSDSVLNSVLRLIFGLLLLPALLIVIIQLTVGFVVNAKGELNQILSFLLSAGSFIFAAVLYVLVTGKIKTIFSFLKLNNFKWMHILVGSLTALATYALAILAGMVASLLVTENAEDGIGQNSTTETINGLTQSHSIVLIGLLIALLAPVGEEIFFRGAMLSSIVQDNSPKWIKVVGVILVAIIFGLFHMQEPTGTPADFIAVITPALVGLTSGIVTLIFNSLYPAIFTHMFYNGVVLLMISS